MLLQAATLGEEKVFPVLMMLHSDCGLKHYDFLNWSTEGLSPNLFSGSDLETLGAQQVIFFFLQNVPSI